nr:ferredoxin [Desulfuribacillus stibiiarsenatis]
MAMKATVDQDLCISCGACIDICSEVFDWNDDGKAHVKSNEISSDLEDSVREASESCPTDAIPIS